MAYIAVETGSPTLRMTTSIHVISPTEYGERPSCTLYLLHGAGDNASTWHRMTTMETYAQKYGCTVIMPEANRSYYTDMAYGLDYFYYITEELPRTCANLIHMNQDPELTYVAGLSMGGYGALKCGLTYPERYRKVVSFSGVTDIQQRLHRSDMTTDLIKEMQGYSAQIWRYSRMKICMRLPGLGLKKGPVFHPYFAAAGVTIRL